MNRNELRGDILKSQNGITLTSLVVYVVLIFVVLAILATVTANFQSSIKEINQDGIEIAEINKFNSYFLQEVKKQDNSIIDITQNSVTFSSKNKYEYDSTNKIINLIELDETGEISRTIEISKNIEECNFKEELQNGKNIIIVEIKAQNTDKITKEYVLNTTKFTSKYQDEEEYVYSTNVLNIQNNNA
jgi:lipopolysaccharide export LptBFGC system permease protein LptF